MKYPFFTIGIPVYNTSKWVGDCLDSILSQDFTDFEIICVNDGSTDNSGNILEHYAKQDSRLSIIHQQNQGLPSARNAVFPKATGKYIYFIDSDDTMCPKALSNAYKYIELNHNPDILETGFFVISGDTISEGKAIEVGEDFFTENINKDTRAIKFLIDGKFRQLSATKFFKAEFLKKYNLQYNPRLFYAEDSEFIIRCRRCADSIASADFFVYNYFNPREGSQVAEMFNPSNVATERKMKMYRSLLEYEYTFYTNAMTWDIPEDYKKTLDKMHTDTVLNRLNFLLSILNGTIKRSVVLHYTDIIEKFSKPQLNKVYKLSGNKSLVFLMFRFLGLRNTVNLLYTYLKLKGVITE